MKQKQALFRYKHKLFEETLLIIEISTKDELSI